MRARSQSRVEPARHVDAVRVQVTDHQLHKHVNGALAPKSKRNDWRRPIAEVRKLIGEYR